MKIHAENNIFRVNFTHIWHLGEKTKGKVDKKLLDGVKNFWIIKYTFKFYSSKNMIVLT